MLCVMSYLHNIACRCVMTHDVLMLLHWAKTSEPFGQRIDSFGPNSLQDFTSTRRQRFNTPCGRVRWPKHSPKASAHYPEMHSVVRPSTKQRPETLWTLGINKRLLHGRGGSWVRLEAFSCDWSKEGWHTTPPVLLGLANGTSNEGPKPLTYFWVIQAVRTTTRVATFTQDMNGRLWLCMPHTAARVTGKLDWSLPSESLRYSPNITRRHRRCITLQFHIPRLSCDPMSSHEFFSVL